MVDINKKEEIKRQEGPIEEQGAGISSEKQENGSENAETSLAEIESIRE